MFYQQKRWITLECLEKFMPGKKASEKILGRIVERSDRRHWEELECFTDVGNTFPVEIKFGDKWVRRGPAHLSITRLYKKCPPLLFSREIQRWDLSKAITSCNSSIFRKARNQSVTNIFEYSNIWIYFYRVFIWTFLCMDFLYKYIQTLVH